MMPKFRAWLKEEQKMVGINFSAREEEMGVMQSTGIQDKNGQEIYDGDIVKVTYPNEFINGLYLVRQAKSGIWRIDNRTQGRELYFSLSGVEVVGNRYENPELLEEVGFD